MGYSYIENKTAIKDDKLDIDLLSSYKLNIVVSSNEFSFAVIEPESQRCLRLESFIFPEVYIPGKNDQLLTQIFQDSHLLPAAFWKEVNVFLANRCYTFVPNSLFDESMGEEFLSYNCEWSSDEQVIGVDKLSDFVVLYGYEKGIVKFFKDVYPNREVNFKCGMTSIIKASEQFVNEKESKVFVYFDHSIITVVCYKNGVFEYCNTFKYSNLDDAVYYVMLVYKELNLITTNVSCTIWGNSESQAQLQSRLFNYIEKVNLGKRPKSMKMSYHFDEVGESRYFGVLNTAVHE